VCKVHRFTHIQLLQKFGSGLLSNRMKSQRIAFFAGYIPSQLPVSCLTVAPRADKLEKAVGRKPLLEVNVISEYDIVKTLQIASKLNHCDSVS
jgi:hypothetical protein